MKMRNASRKLLIPAQEKELFELRDFAQDHFGRQLKSYGYPFPSKVVIEDMVQKIIEDFPEE